ncbi:MAG: extracellular solute-binding protein [Dehalococcoidia bacterium]|nr:extracellular solute-binding protein [Dehalococcoidia bacterium]
MTGPAESGAEQRLLTRRKVLRLAGLGLISIGAAAILSGGDRDRQTRLDAARVRALPDSGPLVVYNSHDSPAVKAVLLRYLRAYPKERLHLIELTPSDAAARVSRERADPGADVWIHPYVTDLLPLASAGVLRDHRSPEDGRLPSRYRDSRGRWYAVSLRPYVMAYNRAILRDARVSPPVSVLSLSDRTWSDNTLGAWRGEAVIALPDPARPSLRYWLGWLAAALDPQAATEYFRALHRQRAAIVGDETTLLAGLAKRRYALGIVEAPLALAHIASNGNDIALAYPEQGNSIGLDGLGVGLTTVTRLRDGAGPARLLDFLISAEAARIMAEQGYEFPARPGIAVPRSHAAPPDGIRVGSPALADVARLEPTMAERAAQVLKE